MSNPSAPLVKIALLGRPNVGKSTLFNVLAIGRENKAITHAVAGTTRDVRQTPAQLFGKPFMLLDTAGVEAGKQVADGLQKQLNKLSLKAAEAADVLLLVIDGAAGLTPADRGLAGELRKFNKPLIVIVNKADIRGAAATANEVESLGFGEAVTISAAHREGLSALEDALAPYIPTLAEVDEAAEVAETVRMEEEEAAAAAELELDLEEVSARKLVSRPVPSPLKLAVLGRPNVGKSTLVNALLRHEAMLTGPTAGLTREAITHGFRALDQDFALIDTPGLRKKTKIEEESLESLSVGQALAALQHAHVLLLVIDASVHNEARGLWQVFEQQDATIAQTALRSNKPIVIVLNKWDAVEDKEGCKADVIAQLRAKLHGIHTPLTVPVSATKKQGLGILVKAIIDIEASYGKAFNTAKLNRTLAAILAKRSPPIVGGRPISLKFLRQICAAPPTFALWGNRVDQISGHYLQFLKHQLSENLGLTALPLTLHLRTNNNPYSGRKMWAAENAKKPVKDYKKQAKAQAKKAAPQKPAKPTFKVSAHKSSKVGK